MCDGGGRIDVGSRFGETRNFVGSASRPRGDRRARTGQGLPDPGCRRRSAHDPATFSGRRREGTAAGRNRREAELCGTLRVAGGSRRRRPSATQERTLAPSRLSRVGGRLSRRRCPSWCAPGAPVAAAGRAGSEDDLKALRGSSCGSCSGRRSSTLRRRPTGALWRSYRRPGRSKAWREPPRPRRAAGPATSTSRAADTRPRRARRLLDRSRTSGTCSQPRWLRSTMRHPRRPHQEKCSRRLGEPKRLHTIEPIEDGVCGPRPSPRSRRQADAPRKPDKVRPAIRAPDDAGARRRRARLERRPSGRKSDARFALLLMLWELLRGDQSVLLRSCWQRSSRCSTPRGACDDCCCGIHAARPPALAARDLGARRRCSSSVAAGLRGSLAVGVSWRLTGGGGPPARIDSESSLRRHRLERLAVVVLWPDRPTPGAVARDLEAYGVEAEVVDAARLPALRRCNPCAEPRTAGVEEPLAGSPDWLERGMLAHICAARAIRCTCLAGSDPCQQTLAATPGPTTAAWLALRVSNTDETCASSRSMLTRRGGWGMELMPARVGGLRPSTRWCALLRRPSWC